MMVTIGLSDVRILQILKNVLIMYNVNDFACFRTTNVILYHLRHSIVVMLPWAINKLSPHTIVVYRHIWWRRFQSNVTSDDGKLNPTSHLLAFSSLLTTFINLKPSGVAKGRSQVRMKSTWFDSSLNFVDCMMMRALKSGVYPLLGAVHIYYIIVLQYFGYFNLITSCSTRVCIVTFSTYIERSKHSMMPGEN